MCCGRVKCCWHHTGHGSLREREAGNESSQNIRKIGNEGSSYKMYISRVQPSTQEQMVNFGYACGIEKIDLSTRRSYLSFHTVTDNSATVL